MGSTQALDAITPATGTISAGPASGGLCLENHFLGCAAIGQIAGSSHKDSWVGAHVRAAGYVSRSMAVQLTPKGSRSPLVSTLVGRTALPQNYTHERSLHSMTVIGELLGHFLPEEVKRTLELKLSSSLSLSNSLRLLWPTALGIIKKKVKEKFQSIPQTWLKCCHAKWILSGFSGLRRHLVADHPKHNWRTQILIEYGYLKVLSKNTDIKPLEIHKGRPILSISCQLG